MSVNSQDVYVNLNTPLTVIGGGGGGSIPSNLEVSTLSAPGLLNISSINGAPYVGAGSIPANLTVSSISTLALNNVSSINGAPYVSGGVVPANLVVSSLTAVSTSVSTRNVSSINGTINIDDIPYLYLQKSGLKDTVISSISGPLSGQFGFTMSTLGAPLTGNFSTVVGHQYIAQGCMRISSVGADWPAGSPSAFLGIWGGGGPAQGFVNAVSYSYPLVSTTISLSSGRTADLQWSAPGAFSYYNPNGSAITNSTIQYYAFCSADWPIPIRVSVSSLVGAIDALGQTDAANISFVDLGNFNDTPPV